MESFLVGCPDADHDHDDDDDGALITISGVALSVGGCGPRFMM